MKSKIFYAVLVLFLGFLGGVAADWLLPTLGIIDVNTTTIINKTEGITITENEALENAVDRIKPAVVAVEVTRSRLVTQYTGFILTSDGLVVTTSDGFVNKYDKVVVKNADWQAEAEVQKIDSANNLALLKIERNFLPVVELASLEDIRLGEAVILMGMEVVKNPETFYRFINTGTVRSVKDESLSINLVEENVLASGGPTFNIKAQVIGLNVIDKEGLQKTVPTNKIRQLLGN